MKKRLCLLLFVLLVIPYLALGAAADGTYVIDNADLFTSDEETILENTIADLRWIYEMDVVILTVESLNGQRPQDYADDYYDSHGYGEDGVLFLLSMEERDWYISTCGNAIYALTDYGIQMVGETILPYLASGDYYEAFVLYLDTLPEYFDALAAGQPIDGSADYSGDYYHGDREEVIYYEEAFTPSLIVAFLGGLIIAVIAIIILRIQMVTRRPKRTASDYLKVGSFRVTQQQDMFLYSKVSKVRKPQENSTSGGGSSVHRSSSGRSHGGGGGKF